MLKWSVPGNVIGFLVLRELLVHKRPGKILLVCLNYMLCMSDALDASSVKAGLVAGK